MKNIVFFNHFNRGDLFANSEFVKQIVKELPNVNFEYMHYQPSNITDTLGIKYTGQPIDSLNKKTTIYKQGDTLYVNTWAASNWDIFCKHGGVNLDTLTDLWGKIFKAINKFFKSNLKIKGKKDYLSKPDYSIIDDDIKKSIDSFFESSNTKKILICNGTPQSGQSFLYSIEDFIKEYFDNNNYTFIFTEKNVSLNHKNVTFTNDIFTPTSQSDLFEISYLSKFCDIIIGRNSGPYTYSETYYNYMDKNKTFICFNTKNPAYEKIQESLSWNVKHLCKYKTVPIISINDKQDEDVKNIKQALKDVII